MSRVKQRIGQPFSCGCEVSAVKSQHCCSEGRENSQRRLFRFVGCWLSWGAGWKIVTPLWQDLSMTQFQVAKFAEAGRRLAAIARGMGLLAPSFRTPPRVLGHNRTIRREGDVVLVSVMGRGRAWEAVLADMIEGVVCANEISAPQADLVRNELWFRLGEVCSNSEALEGSPLTEEPIAA